MRALHPLVTLTLIVATAAAAHADELILKDGSRLVGQVQQLYNGKVLIKTDFAGDLTIEAEKIVGVQSDEPITVQLDSGDRAVGRLRYDENASQQRVVGDVVGDKPIAVGSVQRMWRQGAADPADAAAAAELEKQRPKWALRIEMGLNGETGNSERVNFNGRIEANRTTPDDRLTIYGLGRYAHESGDDTAREFIGGARYEYDISPKLFLYGGIELENDKFENLDLRAIATGGLGVFIVQKDETELKFRAGLGFQHEAFSMGGGTNQEPVAEFGVDFFHEFNEWLRYTHSTTVLPSLDEFGEFRLTMENAAEVPISKDKAWKLRLGVRNQYDSEPSGMTDKLDTFYFANLSLDF